jgi:hypothetical protein
MSTYSPILNMVLECQKTEVVLLAASTILGDIQHHKQEYFQLRTWYHLEYDERLPSEHVMELINGDGVLKILNALDDDVERKQGLLSRVESYLRQPLGDDSTTIEYRLVYTQGNCIFTALHAFSKSWEYWSRLRSDFHQFKIFHGAMCEKIAYQEKLTRELEDWLGTGYQLRANLQYIQDPQAKDSLLNFLRRQLDWANKLMVYDIDKQEEEYIKQYPI